MNKGQQTSSGYSAHSYAPVDPTESMDDYYPYNNYPLYNPAPEPTTSRPKTPPRIDYSKCYKDAAPYIPTAIGQSINESEQEKMSKPRLTAEPTPTTAAPTHPQPLPVVTPKTEPIDPTPLPIIVPKSEPVDHPPPSPSAPTTQPIQQPSPHPPTPPTPPPQQQATSSSGAVIKVETSSHRLIDPSVIKKEVEESDDGFQLLYHVYDPFGLNGKQTEEQKEMKLSVDPVVDPPAEVAPSAPPTASKSPGKDGYGQVVSQSVAPSSSGTQSQYTENRNPVQRSSPHTAEAPKKKQLVAPPLPLKKKIKPMNPRPAASLSPPPLPPPQPSPPKPATPSSDGKKGEPDPTEKFQRFLNEQKRLLARQGRGLEDLCGGSSRKFKKRMTPSTATEERPGHVWQSRTSSTHSGRSPYEGSLSKSQALTSPTSSGRSSHDSSFTKKDPRTSPTDSLNGKRSQPVAAAPINTKKPRMSGSSSGGESSSLSPQCRTTKSKQQSMGLSTEEHSDKENRPAERLSNYQQKHRLPAMDQLKPLGKSTQSMRSSQQKARVDLPSDEEIFLRKRRNSSTPPQSPLRRTNQKKKDKDTSLKRRVPSPQPVPKKKKAPESAPSTSKPSTSHGEPGPSRRIAHSNAQAQAQAVEAKKKPMRAVDSVEFRLKKQQEDHQRRQQQPSSSKPKPPTMESRYNNADNRIGSVQKGEQRVAHKVKTIKQEPGLQSKKPPMPLSHPSSNKTIPPIQRQTVVEQLFNLLMTMEAPDAHSIAQQEELAVYKRTNRKDGYIAAFGQVKSRLRKKYTDGISIVNPNSQSFDKMVNKPLANATVRAGNDKREKSPNEMTCAELHKAMVDKKLVATIEQLDVSGYPLPDPARPNQVVIKETEYDKNKKKWVDSKDFDRVCCRCHKVYKLGKTVHKEKGICQFHDRKKKWNPRAKGEKKYKCCGQDWGTDGCMLADAHVFESQFKEDLATFLPTPRSTGPDDPRNTKVYAFDCEMVYTMRGTALARLTVVDIKGVTVLDQLVRPIGQIIDPNTKFSGLTMEDVLSATCNLEQCRRQFFKLINEKTILIGHGLESDLKAMRMVHMNVVDTSLIFKTTANGFKRGLKDLSADHLKKSIQDDNDANEGHDSAEDARAAMELVLYKLKTPGV